MYRFLDIFFLCFHSALVLFNLFGWIFRKTRKLNLMTLFLTGFSWGVLGLFYGFGYCPLTDWHWQVLEHLGARVNEISYIQYLIDRIFSIKVKVAFVDNLTLGFYIAALCFSLYFNFFRKNKTSAL